MGPSVEQVHTAAPSASGSSSCACPVGVLTAAQLLQALQPKAGGAAEELGNGLPPTCICGRGQRDRWLWCTEGRSPGPSKPARLPSVSAGREGILWKIWVPEESPGGGHEHGEDLLPGLLPGPAGEDTRHGPCALRARLRQEVHKHRSCGSAGSTRRAGSARAASSSTCCVTRIFIIWAISSWFCPGPAPQDQAGPWRSPVRRQPQPVPQRHFNGNCWMQGRKVTGAARPRVQRLDERRELRRLLRAFIRAGHPAGGPPGNQRLPAGAHHHRLHHPQCL
nr:uncharacterized protein LOC103347373 isoform X3 [Oryctolagus cuniculus]